MVGSRFVRGERMRKGLVLLLVFSSPTFAPAQEPAVDVVAVVLGEEIQRTPGMDGRQLMGIVLGSLLERYVAENDLEPTEEEIDALVEVRAARPGPGGEPWPPEVLRESARHIVRAFKINRSLYEQYGGRVIFQQMGPEPLDAYRAFLEERQEAGDFRILAPGLLDGFWEYFVDDSIHSFYPSEEAERVMKIPWWLQTSPPD